MPTQTAVHSPRWLAVYRHPIKPHVEVRVRTVDKPHKRRTFKIAGGAAQLVAHSITAITQDTPNNAVPKESKEMATRTRPKRSTKPKPTGPDPDDIDLDGLDELDVDDLTDLDLDDEVEVVEEDEPEPEDDDDLDLDDEPAPAPKGKRKKAPEPDEDEDDDLSDLDLDEDDEDEPAPKARAKTKPTAKPAPRERPLSDAQVAMLKTAYARKAGAPVDNIGKQRTADALVSRKLARYVPGSDKTVVEPTAAGAKQLGKAKREPVVFKAPKPAASKPAARSGAKTAPKPAASRGALPKGMYGVAQIAKAAGGVHEETVRRVLRLNEDRFSQTDGRWQFTKDEAREVVREVKSYVKYTGGKRGRPAGATTALADGKVGPSYIAEAGGVHRNTVYNFLRKHAAKFERFKSDTGTYEFTEGQADKIAAKLAANKAG